MKHVTFSVGMITDTPERIYGLSLMSGGLDSRLAALVLRDQGMVVHAVCFESPFFSADSARDAAAQLDMPLHIVDFSADIVALLEKPKHGFGRCMNPCIDCHATMLNRAGQLMDDMGFHLLCTGEVLDERPMSQNFRSLGIVAKECGYGDVLVRPLSAQHLPETKPEQLGWVDRSKLLSIRGRSRKHQLQLAEHYGLKEFPSPAGGCRLTEPNFCRRLKDLQEHEGLNGKRSLDLLRYGRHFRLADKLKVIVGRNEQDNAVLEGGAELYDLILKVEEFPGPTVLVPFTALDDQVEAAAAICARYSDCPEDQEVSIKIRSSRGMRRIKVKPADRQKTDEIRV